MTTSSGEECEIWEEWKKTLGIALCCRWFVVLTFGGCSEVEKEKWERVLPV